MAPRNPIRHISPINSTVGPQSAGGRLEVAFTAKADPKAGLPPLSQRLKGKGVQCPSEISPKLNSNSNLIPKAVGNGTWRHRRRSVWRKVWSAQRQPANLGGRDRVEKALINPTGVGHPSISQVRGRLNLSGFNAEPPTLVGPKVVKPVRGPISQEVKGSWASGSAGSLVSQARSSRLRPEGLVDSGPWDPNPFLKKPGLIVPDTSVSSGCCSSLPGIPVWPEQGKGNPFIGKISRRQQHSAKVDQISRGGSEAFRFADELNRFQHSPVRKEAESHFKNLGTTGGGEDTQMQGIEKSGDEDRIRRTGAEKVRSRFRQVYRRRARPHARGSCEVGLQRVRFGPRLNSIVIKPSSPQIEVVAADPIGSSNSRGEFRLLRRSGSVASLIASSDPLVIPRHSSPSHAETGSDCNVGVNWDGLPEQDGGSEQGAQFKGSLALSQEMSRVRDSVEVTPASALGEEDSVGDRVNWSSESDKSFDGSSDEEGLWRMQVVEPEAEKEILDEVDSSSIKSIAQEAVEGQLPRRECLANVARSVEVGKPWDYSFQERHGDMGRRNMEWAGRAKHMGGIPRKMVFMGVGAFVRVVSNLLNSTSVHNAETLIRLVRSRPPGIPLITVSNHISTLDDPLLWGFKGFPLVDAKLARWVLAAEDICFKNSMLSYFFRLGKCIPITRGAGIYQEHMDEALDRLIDGAWLHTFPEGKVSQEDAPIRRLKWGTASLIVRAPVTPIVLPIVHRGFEKVMPENSFFGRRPPFPLCNKDIKIIIGEPIEFNLPRLRQTAISMSRELSFPSLGWPTTVPHGLNEAAQRWLYTTISDRIQTVMESLRDLVSPFSKLKV
ncbi:hypothetical protein HHK36_002359 [Tetracentron sinense]|uniref:Phospholipid/glycerol acyltransferase domain-containing protein n=1 Tax=Tetracentron sinense TaxID=13715 RepID=A0A834ZM97_TETSI|nr:hypothetical protein HHK36_002359 [Tetracentron sinense]